MLTTLTAMLTPAADPVIVMAPPGVTAAQVWLTLLISLPSLIAATAAAVTSVRNATKLQAVRRDVNGRVEQLVEAKASLAHAAGHAEGRQEERDGLAAQLPAVVPTREDIDRLEQTLAAFVAYAHQRNHDVLGGLHGIRQAIEVVRLTAAEPPPQEE